MNMLFIRYIPITVNRGNHKMFDLVLSNGNLITMNQNNDIFYNKDIFIKDGKILAIKGTSNKKNINHMVLNF